MHTPSMFLPRSDGTRDVFCENSLRRRKPCQEYVKLDADGNIISGLVTYTVHHRQFFCSWSCAANYANRVIRG